MTVTGNHIHKRRKGKKNEAAGYLFILPVLLGVLIFTAFPMAVSLYYSFSDYNITLGRPGRFGVFNYINAFTLNWKETSQSLKVTGLYTLVSVPLTLLLGFILGMFMNQKVKGIGVFRMLYYTPVILPAVVAQLIWQNISDPDYGVLNYMFSKIGLPAYPFFNSPETAAPSLFFMSLFSLGGSMVLWLAQLKTIPPSLYEAAKLDGAGFWRRIFRITVPMCTPMIFYNLLLSTIMTMQTFSTAYMLLNNLNREGLNFFVIRIYGQAFNNWQMGEACALSWILFAIIGVISVVMFKTSKWVFYGEDA